MCKSLLNFLNRKLLKENFSEDELKEKAKKLLHEETALFDYYFALYPMKD